MGGKVALGFGIGRIRTLVSMATDISHRLTMEKKTHKKSLPKPQGPKRSYILSVAVYSTPVYEPIQATPWGVIICNKRLIMENI